ncbi:MAG TPA: hypothetical protein VMD30_13830 [Tepidisphaeraceae bacterium]|nr:hypothetical protein [Tepidisphaeraceae bacterium]
MTEAAGAIPSVSPVVTGDTPCRRCQYNLRTLAVDGVCPECGTPVALSVRGDLLQYSDPMWLGKLASGLLMVLTAVIAEVALFGSVYGMTLAKRPIDRVFRSPVWVPLNAGLFCLMAMGMFLAATPDPAGLGEEEYGRPRRWVRVLLAVEFAGQITMWIRQIALPARQLFIALTIAGSVASLAGAVTIFAFLAYLSRLALRIPDEHLFRRGNAIKWGLLVSYGVALLGWYFLLLNAVFRATWLLRARSTPEIGGIIGCFYIVVGLAVLIFGIMYLLFLHRARCALKQQAALAEQLWRTGAS